MMARLPPASFPRGDAVSRRHTISAEDELMVAQPVQKQDAQPQRTPIAGEAFLRALADHGIDYFFANPGTDFAPVVEAFSRAQQSNAKVPKPMVIPHENLAVAMAHGVYLMTGR